MAYRTIWTSAHTGCWADGALGHKHIRDTLAEELERFPYPNTGELRESLRTDGPDDLSDEDDAIEYLNNYCSGVYFCMVDGDLMLVAEDSDVE